MRTDNSEDKEYVYLFLAIIATLLFSVGSYLAFSDKTSSATATLSFGFLTLILMLISKFKRFEGFGFKAEMWEQELVRAQELISSLEAVSTPLIEQLALLVGTIGYKTVDLPIKSKEALLLQLENLARAMKHDEPRIAAELKPLVQRLCRDYCWEIDWLIEQSLKDLHNKWEADHSSPAFDSALQALTKIETLKQQVWSIDANHMDVLLGIVNESALDIEKKSSLISRINQQKPKFKQAIARLGT